MAPLWEGTLEKGRGRHRTGYCLIWRGAEFSKFIGSLDMFALFCRDVSLPKVASSPLNIVILNMSKRKHFGMTDFWEYGSMF